MGTASPVLAASCNISSSEQNLGGQSTLGPWARSSFGDNRLYLLGTVCAHRTSAVPLNLVARLPTGPKGFGTCLYLAHLSLSCLALLTNALLTIATLLVDGPPRPHGLLSLPRLPLMNTEPCDGYCGVQHTTAFFICDLSDDDLVVVIVQNETEHAVVTKGWTECSIGIDQMSNDQIQLKAPQMTKKG